MTTHTPPTDTSGQGREQETVCDTQFGFKWGPVEVMRAAQFPGGHRSLIVQTPRAQVDVYVTKTGVVRVFSKGKEWKPVR